MKTLSRLFAAAGLIVAMLALTAPNGGGVAAHGAKPAVPVAEHVQLEYAGVLNNPCFSGAVPVARVFPDGTSVPAFVVPADSVLVITDVDGIIRQDVPWTLGYVGALGAGIPVGSITKTILAAYAPLNADALSAGMVSMSLHSQAGYRFGPGLPVCVFATQIYPNGGSTADVVRARLQGYLITQ
jgi:hypothetical protein